MAAPQILTLAEFAERLRMNGTSEEQRFAKEILDNEDDLDAAYQAALAADEFLVDAQTNDPVAVIEELHQIVIGGHRRLEALREVFVEVGAITDDDTESDLPALLRALLS